MVYNRKTTVTRAHKNDNTGKKQKSLDTEAGITSVLPTAVLCKIVQCLPLRDAIGTSILFKWCRIWTLIPSLVFDDQCFTRVKFDTDTLDFYSIISRILFQHRGPILKFALSIPSLEDTPDVNPWISYLSTKDIRDFSLHNKHNMPIELSSELYYMIGLEKLKLTCIIYTSAMFRGFPNLTILVLVEVFISYSILRDVLRSCPLLEKLELIDCVGLQISNISIDVPKLRCFVINSEFCSLDVKNVETLVSASIVTQKMSLPNIQVDLINALQRSSKLEMLGLGGYSCRVYFRQGHRPNIFQKLRNLELLSLVLNNLDDFISTVYCIQSLSNVERLNISPFPRNLDDNVLDYNPDWTLQQLRCASVSLRNASNTELQLIEYLLGFSPVLEKLSVSFMSSVSQSMYSRMLMQLNQFCRASHKVDVYLEPIVIMPERILI